MSALHEMFGLWAKDDQLSPQEKVESLAPLLSREARKALSPIIRSLPNGVLQPRFGSGLDREDLMDELTQEFLCGLLDPSVSGRTHLESLLTRASSKPADEAPEDFARLLSAEANRFVARMRTPSVAWNLTKRALEIIKSDLNCVEVGKGIFGLPASASNLRRITPAEISEVARRARQLPQLDTTATVNLPRLLSKESLRNALRMLLENGRTVGREDLRRFFLEMYAEWDFSVLETNEAESDLAEDYDDIMLILDGADETRDDRMEQMVHSLDNNDLLFLQGEFSGLPSRDLEQQTGLNRQQVYRKKNVLFQRIGLMMSEHDASRHDDLAALIHNAVVRRLTGSDE